MTGPLPGDYGVVATHGGPWWQRITDAAIRYGTSSPVNHAVLYIGDGQLVEARGNVHLSPASEYAGIIWSTGRLGDLTPTSAQRQQITSAALSYVGESYNALDIVAIGLAQRRLGRLVDGDEWWVKRLSDNHRLICSQLVDAAYQAAGIHLFADGRLPGLVSPGDLLGLLQPA